jgi:hypothetical protein
MTSWSTTKLAVSVVSVAIYFLAAAYLKFTYVPAHPPAGTIMQLKAPFESFYGSDLAYAVKVPELDAFSDNNDTPRRSNYLVYENDHPLGPAHSEHAKISKLGNGRFSHWNREGFIFSSSDNSNPKTTGRRYWIVLPKDRPNE